MQRWAKAVNIEQVCDRTSQHLRSRPCLGQHMAGEAPLSPLMIWAALSQVVHGNRNHGCMSKSATDTGMAGRDSDRSARLATVLSVLLRARSVCGEEDRQARMLAKSIRLRKLSAREGKRLPNVAARRRRSMFARRAWLCRFRGGEHNECGEQIIQAAVRRILQIQTSVGRLRRTGARKSFATRPTCFASCGCMGRGCRH